MKLQQRQPAGFALVPESQADSDFVVAHGLGAELLQGSAPVLDGQRLVGLVLDPLAVMGPLGPKQGEPMRTDVVMLSEESQPLAFSASDSRLRQQPPSRVLWFPRSCEFQPPQLAQAAESRG